MLARFIAELARFPLRSVRAQRARAHLHAGTRAAAAGRLEDARRQLEQALALQGGAGLQAWLALGDVLRMQGDVHKAVMCYRNALSGDPSSVQAILGLGRSLRASGNVDGAIGALRRAYAAEPAEAGVLRELVSALIEIDHCERAKALASQALARAPDSPEAIKLLGMAHLKLHESIEALKFFERALRIRDDDPELYDLIGSAWQERGELARAIEAYDRAIALRPDFRLARFHRALVALLQGDFERGWEGYTLREPPPGASGVHSPPPWDGTALSGRTLLVRREQGIGDEIMFASMLPRLLGDAAAVYVECDPRLRALFSRSFPKATVFGGLPGGALPHALRGASIDVETLSGSLPRFLRRRPEDFPRHDGYLKADPAGIDRWRARLDALGPGIKVGLSWIGGVRRTRRALRSLPLTGLEKLLKTPGVHFVSLQYTEGAAEDSEALRAATGITVHHWPEAIADYDETAALVCALDLVISVCTSIVHLSGALGRPVWVMAPYSPEWRYGFTLDSMPWYPSVRVYRQPRYGEWTAVIDEVTERLRSLVVQRS